MNEREFTLDEARAALGRARAPLLALREVQTQIRAQRDELAGLRREHRHNGRGRETQEQALLQRLSELAAEARRHLDEVRETGAEVKGIEQGLLDFPTHVEGVPAYWCWQLGEPDIAWWHPRDSGFAGRRSVAELR